MANERRLIEIPADGIIREPLMDGEKTVGERYIDLSDMPTVDAVEVCYCKDCRYYGMWSDGSPMHSCLRDASTTWDDDFCSRGEKRCD